jgi:site-specific recombinase XerD
MTPAEQQLVLQQAEQRKLIPTDIQHSIVFNNNQKEAVAIRKYKAELNGQFAQNTLQAREYNPSIDLPPSEVLITKDPLELQTFLEQKFERLNQENQGLALQNLALFKAVEESKDQITSLIKEKAELSAQRDHDLAELAAKRDQEIQLLLTSLHALKDKENIVLLRRQQRKNAKRKPLRDYVSFEDAQKCILLVDRVHPDPYVAARTKIVLIILYFAGLRLSNLLLMQVKHLNELIDKGNTFIDIIKKGRQRQMIVVGPVAQQILKDHIDFVNIICENKQEHHLLITSKYEITKPIHRVQFNRSVNTVLKLASVQLNKNILSHSFRVSVITDLIEQQGIENTQDYIGHSNINTTKLYRRRTHEDEHYTQILNKVQKERGLDYIKTRVGRHKLNKIINGL